MKTSDYPVRPISMDEVQQLLGDGSRPVYLLLYVPDPDGEFPPAPVASVAAASHPDKTISRTAACNTHSQTAAYGTNVISADGSNTPVEAKLRERMLSDFLHQLGIPAHIRGYRYLKQAIVLCLENPGIICAITKELYPGIAKIYGSTSPNVERAIRHAIETAWNRGNLQLLEELFGTTTDGMKARPTNSEFIAMVAEKFRLRLADMNG